MISVYRWDPDRTDCAWHSGPELPAAKAADLPPSCVCWIDLENPTPEEEHLVFESFLPVHKLTLEDVTKPRREAEAGIHFPKVEEFPDYLFVIINPLRPEILKSGGCSPKDLRARHRTNLQLSAILTRQVLITHHYEPLHSVSEVRDFLCRHSGQAGRGPDYLFHLVLDAMVDEYAPIVDGIADSLDAIESRVFKRPSPQLLSRLLRLKRLILALRKTLILEREVLYRLTRGEFELVEDREIAYYRNVYDHLVRYTELIEGAREMVSDLMQTHLSAVSNNLNSIMKVLTMISTVILPMALISGIYGMNFQRLWPDITWEHGFWFALGLMALSGLLSLLFFYWKGWIGGKTPPPPH
jgi:magnesium transporter